MSSPTGISFDDVFGESVETVGNEIRRRWREYTIYRDDRLDREGFDDPAISAQAYIEWRNLRAERQKLEHDDETRVYTLRNDVAILRRAARRWKSHNLEAAEILSEIARAKNHEHQEYLKLRKAIRETWPIVEPLRIAPEKPGVTDEHEFLGRLQRTQLTERQLNNLAIAEARRLPGQEHIEIPLTLDPHPYGREELPAGHRIIIEDLFTSLIPEQQQRFNHDQHILTWFQERYGPDAKSILRYALSISSDRYAFYRNVNTLQRNPALQELAALRTTFLRRSLLTQQEFISLWKRMQTYSGDEQLAHAMATTLAVLGEQADSVGVHELFRDGCVFTFTEHFASEPQLIEKIVREACVDAYRAYKLWVRYSSDAVWNPIVRDAHFQLFDTLLELRSRDWFLSPEDMWNPLIYKSMLAGEFISLLQESSQSPWGPKFIHQYVKLREEDSDTARSFSHAFKTLCNQELFHNEEWKTLLELTDKDPRATKEFLAILDTNTSNTLDPKKTGELLSAIAWFVNSGYDITLLRTLTKSRSSDSRFDAASRLLPAIHHNETLQECLNLAVKLLNPLRFSSTIPALRQCADDPAVALNIKKLFSTLEQKRREGDPRFDYYDYYSSWTTLLLGDNDVRTLAQTLKTQPDRFASVLKQMLECTIFGDAITIARSENQKAEKEELLTTARSGLFSAISQTSVNDRLVHSFISVTDRALRAVAELEELHYANTQANHPAASDDVNTEVLRRRAEQPPVHNFETFVDNIRTVAKNSSDHISNPYDNFQGNSRTASIKELNRRTPVTQFVAQVIQHAEQVRATLRLRNDLPEETKAELNKQFCWREIMLLNFLPRRSPSVLVNAAIHLDLAVAALESGDTQNCLRLFDFCNGPLFTEIASPIPRHALHLARAYSSRAEIRDIVDGQPIEENASSQSQSHRSPALHRHPIHQNPSRNMGSQMM